MNQLRNAPYRHIAAHLRVAALLGRGLHPKSV